MINILLPEVYWFDKYALSRRATRQHVGLVKNLFVMRYIKHSLFLVCCLVMATVSLTSMRADIPADAVATSSSFIVDADDTCTLTVKNSYGSAAASIKVSTDVSGGISCSGGRSFRTDSDGEVTLRWVSGCKLTKIYVDGRGYEVNYKDGGDYTITMK